MLGVHEHTWRPAGKDPRGASFVLTGWYPVAVATATFGSTHQSSAPPRGHLTTLPCPPHATARARSPLDPFAFPSPRRSPRLAPAPLPRTNTDGAAAAGVLRPEGRRRDGSGAGPDNRRPAAAAGGPRAGAGGAVRVAGVRGVAGGRRGGGAAGAGLRRGGGAGRRRRAGGGGAGVPRRLLGPQRVEGPVRVQRLDRAPEGLRGGAPPRHALHAAGRRAGPRPLRRHRSGRARPGRPRRAQVSGARHEGDVPAAEPDDAAGLLHGHAAQPGGWRRRRERGGGAVRERTGDGLRARREQGQVAAERPRGAPHGEGGRRAGGRLGQEGRVGDRPVPALGRVPRHQVRRRPLRPERRAAGARRPAFRPARQPLSCEFTARVGGAAAPAPCDILCT